jgi:hypothetical protein
LWRILVSHTGISKTYNVYAGLLALAIIDSFGGNGRKTLALEVLNYSLLGNWKKIIYAYRAELLFVFKA